jgi:hypothetical protein
MPADLKVRHMLADLKVRPTYNWPYLTAVTTFVLIS